MASQEFYLIEGKLRRTVYAVVKAHLLDHMASLDQDQIAYLARKVKGAITDARDDAVEFMFEAGMLEVRAPRPKKKKTARKR